MLDIQHLEKFSGRFALFGFSTSGFDFQSSLWFANLLPTNAWSHKHCEIKFYTLWDVHCGPEHRRGSHAPHPHLPIRGKLFTLWDAKPWQIHCLMNWHGMSYTKGRISNQLRSTTIYYLRISRRRRIWYVLRERDAENIRPFFKLLGQIRIIKREVGSPMEAMCPN